MVIARSKNIYNTVSLASFMNIVSKIIEECEYYNLKKMYGDVEFAKDYIVSIMHNVPIGTIVLKQVDSKYLIIDGLRRIKIFYDMLKNERNTLKYSIDFYKENKIDYYLVDVPHGCISLYDCMNTSSFLRQKRLYDKKYHDDMESIVKTIVLADINYCEMINNDIDYYDLRRLINGRSDK